MKNYKIIFVFLILLLAPASAFSQEDAAMDMGAYDNFSELKGRISQLLEENAQLKSQHDDLKRQYSLLQGKAGKVNQDIQAMDEYSQKLIERERKHREDIVALGKEQQSLEGQKLLLISKINYTKTELLNFSERQRLSELHLKDLEFTRQQAQMDLKIKEQSFENGLENQAKNLKNLAVQVEQSKKREGELAEQIGALKNEKISYPETLAKLLDENHKLTFALEETRIKREFKEREVINLQDKKNLTQQVQEGILSKARQEHDALEVKVNDLEKQFNDLNGQIESSLSMKQKAQELYQTVIDIDKENQGLRDQILQLQQQFSAL